MSGAWAGLIRPVDVGGQVMQGFQQGQQQAQQNKARAAAAALVRDPTNAAALEALASVDPGAAQQFQQQAHQQALTALEQHRDAIKTGAAIIRQINPKDQAGWTAALSAARQYGIDPAQMGIPESWEQGGAQYSQQLIGIANALDPQATNQGKDIPVAPGGAVLHRNPDGTTQWVVAPAESVPTQPLTDEQIQQLEGGQAGQPSPAPFR